MRQFLLTDSIQRTFALATLICGSLAYDNIMTFQGRFGDHILPDQVHMLNISFLVPTMRRNFGGCAGNIAYALKLLGGDAKIMATLGEADAQLYLDRLDALGLSKEYVRVLPDQHSAQCFITTDLGNNQITAFHPGAMMESHLNRADQTSGITLGIVAPDGADGMRQHAEQFASAGVPFVFDPGQGLPILEGVELRHMIELASYVAVNDYEAKLLSNKTGWSIEDIAGRVKALVVTRGEQGAQIHHEQGVEEIPVVKARAGRRSDRLRRRVPRRLAVWNRKQAWLGEDRSSCQPDGFAENRASGAADLRADAHRNRRTFQAGIRKQPVVMSGARE